MPLRFLLTLWTADPTLAAAADAAGIDRVGLDLERIGKRERQPPSELWHTDHEETHLSAIGKVLRCADLFVRCNPPHPGLPTELDRLLATGVKVVMLPAFRCAEDVRRALDSLAGRAVLVPLLELPDALANIDGIAAVPGLREVRFGLNDLGLGWGLRNRFAALLRPELEHACAVLRDAGKTFGIGGVGRVDDATLPVPSEAIYARYAALGAHGSLLARSFCRNILATDTTVLRAAVTATHARMAQLTGLSAVEVKENKAMLEKLFASGTAA